MHSEHDPIAGQRAAVPDRFLQRGLRRAVFIAVLLSCGLGISLIFTAIGPVLSGISAHFGGGTEGNVIAQMMMTLPSIGVIVGGPLAGFLVERWGARNLLLFMLVLFGAAGCCGLLVDTATPLLASRLVLGCAGVGVATASTALIGEYFAGDRRTRMLGYWTAVGSAGSVLSILLAGVLGDAAGWQGPFAIYGVAFIIFAFALAAVPATGRAAAVAGAHAARPGGRVLMLWPIYVLMIFVAAVVFMTGIQISFLLAANGINSPGTQSWIISAASVGTTTGAVCYGLIQQRLGRRTTFAILLGLMAAGNIVMGTQAEPALTALGCLLNGLGGGMTVPYFGSLIMDRTDADNRGRALGLMYTMIFLGELANPMIVTPLHMVFDIQRAFVIVGILTALGALYTGLRSAPNALPAASK